MRLATMLFVSAILFSVIAIPSVASQASTTITSLLTTTSIWTSSSYSNVTVGTTTVTATSGFTIVSTTNTLTGAGGNYCTWDYWNLTINPGTTEVTGTIGPSSTAESFYIMTAQQYNELRTSIKSGCGSGGAYELGEISVANMQSPYSLDWKNPSPGWYYVVFYTDGTNGNIVTPFSLVAMSTQEQTSTIINMSATQVTGATSETLTSVQVSQIPASTSSPIGIPGFPLESLLIGFFIGLAILLLRRSGKAKNGQ